MTPMKAIRAKCLDCCCGSNKEVALCPATGCPLYAFRFGKNPNIKLTDEQKAKRAALFKKTPGQQGDFANEAVREGNYLPEHLDRKTGG